MDNGLPRTKSGDETDMLLLGSLVLAGMALVTVGALIFYGDRLTQRRTAAAAAAAARSKSRKTLSGTLENPRRDLLRSSSWAADQELYYRINYRNSLDYKAIEYGVSTSAPPERSRWTDSEHKAVESGVSASAPPELRSRNDHPITTADHFEQPTMGLAEAAIDLTAISTTEREGASNARATISIEHPERPPVAVVRRRHSDPQLAEEIREKLIKKYDTIPTSPGGGESSSMANLYMEYITPASERASSEQAFKGSSTAGSVEGSDGDDGPALARQPRLSDKMLFDGVLTDYDPNLAQQDIAGKQDTKKFHGRTYK